MGCLVSTPKDGGGNRRRPSNIGEVSVFVPGLRIPKPVDFSESLGDQLNKSLVERLSALRTRIVVMAGQEAPTITRTRRKTQHGGSTLGDLLHALEDYLPVLLGMVKHGSPLQHRVQFIWVNQEDEEEETSMYSAWYEILSVLHLMAMLSLSQANLLLLPRTSIDGHHSKVSEARPPMQLCCVLRWRSLISPESQGLYGCTRGVDFAQQYKRVALIGPHNQGILLESL